MVVSPGKNWDPSQDILPQSNIGLLTCCCPLTAIFSHFFFWNYGLFNDAVIAAKFITNSSHGAEYLKNRMISQSIDECSSPFESHMFIYSTTAAHCKKFILPVALQFTPSLRSTLILSHLHQFFFRHSLPLKRLHQHCTAFFFFPFLLRSIIWFFCK